MGEGEETIKELIRVLENEGELSTVKGICYKNDEGDIYQSSPQESIFDLDAISFPAWSLFPMDIYLRNPVGAPNRNKWGDGKTEGDAIFSMSVSATRGCPYKCIYCYHDFMGQKYRCRSAQNIVEEIRILHEKYKTRYIHFIDDEFCMNKNFVYGFCRLMRSEFDGKITWGCSGRVNLMTEDLIAVMSDAGCVLIGYGVESGSQKMLDIMKKDVKVEQAKEAIRLTQKYLGWADTSFMIGAPGETKQTMKETVDFCKELSLVPEVIFFTTPYPGTELYRMAIEQGKIVDEEEYILNLGEQGEKIRVNFTDMSDKELYDMQVGMIDELGAWNKLKHEEAR